MINSIWTCWIYASEVSSRQLGLEVWNSEKRWIEDISISRQVALGAMGVVLDCLKCD